MVVWLYTADETVTRLPDGGSALRFFVPDGASPCYGVAIPALYGVCISVRIEQLVSSTIRTSAHYSIRHVHSFRRCVMLGWHWISYGRLIEVWLAHGDCWFEVVICGFQAESGTLIHGVPWATFALFFCRTSKQK